MDSRYPQLIDVALHEDARGQHRKFFGETPAAISVPDFSIAEVFMTVSHRNVIRGLAVQVPVQPKVIQVVSGAVRGNIVCCDPDLPEFGKAIQFYLEAESTKKIYVPGRWAQGYRALEDSTRVLYLAATPHYPDGIGINALDPDLRLYWGEDFDSSVAVRVDRDANLPPFSEVRQKLEDLFATQPEGDRSE